MESASSKREAIQMRLQLLKDEREREQQAFDELAQRQDLTADEIASLAKKKAAEEEPQSLDVNDVHIVVGQKVDVLDDISVLLKAEKGYMVSDPVKQVYLGEKGEVLRIMPSFQGKPAVELRFADGAVKVFFVECIKTAEQCDSSKKKSEASSAPPLKIEKKAPVQTPEKLPTPPVPGWTDLSMPGRGRKNSATQDTATPKKPPMATTDDTKQAEAPREQRAQKPAKAAPSLIPETHDAHEGLGLPLDNNSSNTGDRLVLAAGELDNLVKTPRASFLAAEAAALATKPPHVISDLESQVPQHCLPDYEAKFSFDDPSTQIPRFKSSKAPAVKKCLVAGYVSGQQAPLSFQSIAFRENIDSMDSVLATVTRELGWDVTGERVKRLFSEDGTEIMWADAIVSNMHLVATGGSLYALGTMGAPSSALSNSAHMKHGKESTTTPKRAGTPNGPTSTRKTITPNANVAKPIHIRLFENGEYGDDHFDRAYITVTIRPTYKTISSVKSMFTRELKWRDGKKVDLLFDATGAEIESVEQLVDGACVVASAGDRFVIPFPNTQLHIEAMKLNQ